MTDGRVSESHAVNQSTLSGLLSRWIPEIDPTDLGNVPSGVVGEVAAVAASAEHFCDE